MPVTGADVLQRHAEFRERKMLVEQDIKPVRQQGLCLCEEASPFSTKEYVPCFAPAVALIDNNDRRLYWMCGPCAIHNIENRRAKLVAIKDEADA